MRAVRTIAGVELRRFLRAARHLLRLHLPLLLVLVIGAQFGGEGYGGRVAVAGGRSALRTALVAELEQAGSDVTSAGAGAVREQVARGRADAGVFLTEAAETAYDAGDDLDIEVITGTQLGAQVTTERVRTSAAAIVLERGQVAALTDEGIGPPQTVAALTAASAR